MAKSIAATKRSGESASAGNIRAEQNNRRMAGNAMNALRDMHTDAYRLLDTDRQVTNAREALEDVMWYSQTGRADIDFEGAIGALNKQQQQTFIRGLSEKTRSRDDNVKKAKSLIRKIKPNAGEKRETRREMTDEQRKIADSVRREYQAARTAENVARRYGR